MHHFHLHLHRKKIIEYAIAIFFIIIVFYLGGKIGYGPMIEFMKVHFTLGILLYFSYAIISNIIIPLPLVPLMPIISYLYGFEIAISLTIIGSLIGAIVSFFLAKIFGKRLVIRMMGKHVFNEVDHISQMSSTKNFFLVRLFGNNYYDIISYLAGLSKIKFINYLIITAFTTSIWVFVLFFVIDKSGGVTNITSFLNLMTIYGIIVLVGTICWEIYHKNHSKLK